MKIKDAIKAIIAGRKNEQKQAAYAKRFFEDAHFQADEIEKAVEEYAKGFKDLTNQAKAK